jgi:GNAT superfamily N-acetyltransferase
MPIEIREVKTGAGLKTFIYLPEKIHAGHANWVHPIYMDEKKYFDPKKNKAFEYCDVGLWLAWRDGTPVGRIMGIINRRFNAHRKEDIARFACLETSEDRETFQALVRTVEDWARAKGATRIIGPYGFSDQDPEGWLIEGFGNRATIATYYNFEWMPRFIEEMGYSKDVDYFVYKIPVPKEMPELYAKVFERAQRRGNFVIHEFTRRKDLKPWIVPIFTLMNETYVNSNIYGYAPLSEKEMQDLAKRYLPVVDPRFVKVVTKDGQPAAFIIAMPDMTEGVQKARGRLIPFGFLKVLKAARKTKQLDLLLGAIKESHRGVGLDALMGYKMFKSAQAAGMEFMDTHHELESNEKVRAEMIRQGGVLYKKFRVWTKNL